MTDLLPQCQGQPDTLTVDADTWADHGSHWYSPAAVARMIEEARSEERETCINALAMRCEKYALIGCDDSENVVSECIHIIKGMGKK